MIERANTDGEVDKIILHIKEVLIAHHSQKTYFRSLIQGMKWNINSKELLKDLSDKDAWIILKGARSMANVGYSRVCESGSMYFSDADNCFIRWIQKMRGISTNIKSNTSEQ